MKEKVLGLDLGLQSVGWAVLELKTDDTESESSKILGTGVRVFPVAENKGKSPGENRRENRGARRRLRRLRGRMSAIRRLMIEQGLFGEDKKQYYQLDEQNQLLKDEQGKEKINTKKMSRFHEKQELTPWELRAEALERLLSPSEWAVVLTHLAKRRGFKSNRKNQKDPDKDSGKVLKSIKENKNLLNEYETVGQMLQCNPQFKSRKRNSEKDYSHSVGREDLRHEIEILFERQHTKGNQYATEKFKKDYLDIWEKQLPIDRGNIFKMVGKCTHETKKKRAPKMSYTAECFRVWQDINNNLKIDNESKKEKIEIEKRKLFEEIRSLSIKKRVKVKYSDVRKLLELNKIETIKLKGFYKEEEDADFTEMKGTKKIYKITKKVETEKNKEIWSRLLEYPDALDKMAESVTYYKSDDKICERLDLLKDSPVADILEEIKVITLRLLELDFKEAARLSLKAMKKILPYMEEGMFYSEACEKAGYNHSQVNSKEKKLPVIINESIRSPRVLRALSQARKVVNAVIEKYGSPDKVHIELSRDLAHSSDERKKIKKGQNKFKQEKELAVNDIKEFYPNKEILGKDILKMRLWREQGGVCPYSGNPMDSRRILEMGYCEVDHILPLSRSMDDSKNNQVLCLTKENREKGSRIPFEYLGAPNSDKWIQFCETIKNYPKGKRVRLLKEQFDKEDEKEHREKWVDSPESKWIAREFKNHVEKYLLFNNEDNSNKNRVQTRNGTLTGFLRVKWGLVKIRDKHNRHHALDAMVLAASTQSMVKYVMDWSKSREGVFAKTKADRATIKNEDGEIVSTTWYSEEAVKKIPFPTPWENFKKDVEEHQNNVFVSQPAIRKQSGEIHHERLIKKQDNYKGIFLRKSGGLEHGIPGDKKQKESWYALRTDVFKNNGKYYLSIVYRYHRATGELPSDFVKNPKGINAENSEFLFSLYKGDAVLIRKEKDKNIKRKKEKFSPNDTHAGMMWDKDEKSVTVVGYFRNTHSRDGSIYIDAHDNSWRDSNGKKKLFETAVIKLLSFKKLEIPLLGGVCMEDFENGKYVVKKESRCELEKPVSRKSRYSKP